MAGQSLPNLTKKLNASVIQSSKSETLTLSHKHADFRGQKLSCIKLEVNQITFQQDPFKTVGINLITENELVDFVI